MYSRSAKGGEKGDPNRNPWLAKMGDAVHQPTLSLLLKTTYGKIAGFWAITQKPLIISEI
jgi:hypothetical protein